MNLLTEPLVPILTERAEPERSILPPLLAAYTDDRVFDLPFLRPHQRAPWHSFSVQLARLALHRAGRRRGRRRTRTTWRKLLRGLTAEWPEDEPWRLVVEDVTKPAFMQPPVPAGSGDPHRTPIRTADDLDVLVTAKNHGIKQGIGADASPAAWVAALVLLQTTGGFLGAGNYGISRMNGGFATRPWVGLVPPGGIGRALAPRRHRASAASRLVLRAGRGIRASGRCSAALVPALGWRAEPWARRARPLVHRDLPAGSALSRRDGNDHGQERRLVRRARRRERAARAMLAIPGSRSISARSPQPTTRAPRYAVMSEVLFERNRWRAAAAARLAQGHRRLER